MGRDLQPGCEGGEELLMLMRLPS